MIDKFLDNITMYRLMLVYLLTLLGVAVAFSFSGFLVFNPFSLVFSAFFLTVVCWLSNEVFARCLKISANVESVFISALILTLIVTPARDFRDLAFLAAAGVFAMSSKYILAFKRKHIFNPAALAVFLTAVFLGRLASWWVGDPTMVLPVALGGLLILRKTGRGSMVAAFLGAVLLTTLLLGYFQGSGLILVFQATVFYSPLLFFALVMLTEPQTVPLRLNWQIAYAVAVGILFAPQWHFGRFFLTPELALLTGNIFSFLTGPKGTIMMVLSGKSQLSADIFEFVFTSFEPISFRPGQYLEWTLGHKNPDSRGNRRFFTLASSPTEDKVRIGVKFSRTPSSFKKNLLALRIGERIFASRPGGGFVLPKDPDQKLVFVAGGIGITPFRSMLKYLTDKKERRNIVLFWANKRRQEIVFQDVISRAGKKAGLKVVETLTDEENRASSWKGKLGRIDGQMIRSEVPDFQERIFYLSGPQIMVQDFKRVLRGMGIAKGSIKTDYFPGFA